jgi:DNA-binding transcriptional LysR family regulator
MFAWDDIGLFLALYRERTTGRAASALGVSQPTIVRRLAAFEHALGIPLFDRTQTGLVPLEGAHQLYGAAQRVERSICEFTGDVEILTQSHLKIIRLTFLDHFEQLLVPVLREFSTRWPNVQTQLLASDHVYDLARGEVDIGVRGRDRPTSEEVVVHQLPSSGWTIYASSHMPPEERPTSPEGVAGHPLAIVEGVPATLPVYRWLKAQADDSSPPTRCNNYRAIKSLVASGAAISALPCTIGDDDPGIVRCFPPLEEWDVPIYLVARRAVLRRAAARDLFDSIAEHFRRNPELLMGVR